MPRLFVALIVTGLIAAPAALAADPPPKLISPANNKTVKKTKRAVVFKVRGLADGDNLRIQIGNADSRVGDTGLFYNPDEEESGGIDDYALTQVDGTDVYKARVPRSKFKRYGDPNFYWLAYRALAEGSPDCLTTESGDPDCFQESRTRAFTYNVI
jgi:hypothetical protein